ncbi:MAG: hypothetical protein ACPGNV_15520 [Mangrovicoccus sp.]
MKKKLISVLTLMVLASPSWGADFSDPTWPCIQRKVERLSPGLMWPAVVEPSQLPAQTASDAKDLVARLTLRRLPLEEVEPYLTAFTDSHGASPELLGQVFLDSFTQMSRLRTRIIQGIEKYSLSQIALAERIDSTRQEMDQIMSTDAPDFDKVDALEEQLDWDERIYLDRQRSLTYICETPILLEKRLYAIAQMLQGATDS